MFRDRPIKPSPTLLIDVIHSEFGPFLVIIVILYLSISYGSLLYGEMWTLKNSENYVNVAIQEHLFDFETFVF